MPIIWIIPKKSLSWHVPIAAASSIVDRTFISGFACRDHKSSGLGNRLRNIWIRNCYTAFSPVFWVPDFRASRWEGTWACRRQCPGCQDVLTCMKFLRQRIPFHFVSFHSSFVLLGLPHEWIRPKIKGKGFSGIASRT